MSVAWGLAAVAYGVVMGFLLWYAMVKSQVRDWMHLRSLGDRIRFYFMPYPPRNLIALVWPNGDVDIHVDAEVEADSRGYTVRIPGGVLWTPKLPWHTLALIETAVVPRQPSPYAIAWRVLAGWIASWVIGYYTLILTAPVISLSEPGFLIPSTALIMEIVYIFVVYMAVATPNTPTTMLVVKGVTPPSLYAEPAEGPLGVSPMEKARLRGHPIVIKVPREARSVFEEIKRMLRVPADKAAEILAKLSLFSVYRRSLASMQAHYRPLHEIARSMVRMQVTRITLTRGILMLLVFVIGVGVGWALGGGTVVISPVSVEQPQAPAAPAANATAGPGSGLPAAQTPSLSPGVAPGG